MKKLKFDDMCNHLWFINLIKIQFTVHKILYIIYTYKLSKYTFFN